METKKRGVEVMRTGFSQSDKCRYSVPKLSFHTFNRKLSVSTDEGIFTRRQVASMCSDSQTAYFVLVQK